MRSCDSHLCSVGGRAGCCAAAGSAPSRTNLRSLSLCASPWTPNTGLRCAQRRAPRPRRCAQRTARNGTLEDATRCAFWPMSSDSFPSSAHRGMPRFRVHSSRATLWHHAQHADAEQGEIRERTQKCEKFLRSFECYVLTTPPRQHMGTHGASLLRAMLHSLTSLLGSARRRGEQCKPLTAGFEPTLPGE